MTERFTISMPDDMAESINSQLAYGDNRSEWIRDAIREKLDRDAEVSDTPNAAIETHESDTGEEHDDVAHDADAYADVEIPQPLADEIARYRSELERAGTDHVDERVAAAEAVGRMLVAEDGVSRSQAQERLLPAYEVPGVSADTWWKRAGKERFSRVDAIQWSQTEQKYILK